MMESELVEPVEAHKAHTDLVDASEEVKNRSKKRNLFKNDT
jgi:hypothetical protein